MPTVPEEAKVTEKEQAIINVAHELIATLRLTPDESGDRNAIARNLAWFIYRETYDLYMN